MPTFVMIQEAGQNCQLQFTSITQPTAPGEGCRTLQEILLTEGSSAIKTARSPSASIKIKRGPIVYDELRPVKMRLQLSEFAKQPLLSCEALENYWNAAALATCTEQNLPIHAGSILNL